MRVLFAVLLVASLYGAFDAWRNRAFVPPEGEIASAPPVQVDLDHASTFDARGATLQPRARYSLTVRLLRKERYRLDGGASIAPWDLAVGWGPMSDSQVLEQLDITQMGRFFYWRPRDASHFPLEPRELVVSAAQIHAIPADREVEDTLSRMRRGQVLTLRGQLVDVRTPGGGRWSTSLRRDDTGDGACEIMWVESIEVR